MRLNAFAAAGLAIAALALAITATAWRSTVAIADQAATTSLPSRLIVGPDGNLWFAELTSSRIARLTPSGTFTEFLTPTPHAQPSWIAFTPDGNLWFSEQSGNHIGRLSPAGKAREFRLPIAGTEVDMVVLGPDKRIWFDAAAPTWHLSGAKPSHTWGVVDSGGNVREFTRPGKAVPSNVMVGPDGNVWFDEAKTSSLLRVTPDLHLTALHILGLSVGTSIIIGSDGNLWAHGENSIIRITPAGGSTKFAIPTASSQPGNLVVGQDNNVWFSEKRGNKIGRISPDGHIVEFSLPAGQSQPEALVVGPDKDIWFCEAQGNRIGRISPDGEISEFTVPTAGSYPDELVDGPDGNLWFLEPQSNHVGRITPSGEITEFAIPSRVDTRLEHTPPPSIPHH